MLKCNRMFRCLCLHLSLSLLLLLHVAPKPIYYTEKSSGRQVTTAINYAWAARVLRSLDVIHASKEDLHVGDRIEQIRKDQFYNGVVKTVRPDGTYDVVYDDGDKESSVRKDQLRAMKSSIKLVFEVGSRDCLDANFLAFVFNATVYSFEANPENLPVMMANNKDQDRVKIIRSAVSSIDGYVQFYPYNLSLYNNRGAGSLYLADFVNNRNITDPDYNRSSVQYKTNVSSTRLDTFITKTLPTLEKSTNTVNKLRIPDLLCLDVQESELEVLRSASHYLSSIKHVIFESSQFSQYVGGSTFLSIHEYMVSKGFNLTASKIGRNVVMRKMPTMPMKKDGVYDFLYSHYTAFKKS